MIAAPQIETASLADLDSLARLRTELGWRRSDSLLRGVMTWEHGRVFVVRVGALIPAHGAAASVPAATTSAIAAGPVGIIGNVAVRPEFQLRGLGRLLTSHALTWQRAQGVRSVWLDATPAGRPLYRQLGFTDMAASWYSYSPLRDLHLDRLSALAGDVIAEPAPPEALASIAALDCAAFGGDRLGLLMALAQQQSCALYLARASHANEADRRPPLGYALARQRENPAQGVRIGPLVAPDDTVAAALTHAIAQTERQRFPHEFASGESYLTVGGGDAPEVRAFFDAIGAPTQDDDLVMRLTMGAKTSAPSSDGKTRAESKEGKPSVYCWISPMLF